eukprot:m.166805 g.166805  ORF g.166805 m.166805 type:complete len:124 (-) comp16631_c0_seq4:2188-2559(-)
MGLFSWAARVWKDVTGQVPSDDEDDDDEFSVTQTGQPLFTGPLLVFETLSDAFRDEDGFIGHEFYVESADGRTMERVTDGLEPVGIVPLDKPVINRDAPMLLCERRYFVEAGLLPPLDAASTR